MLEVDRPPSGLLRMSCKTIGVSITGIPVRLRSINVRLDIGPRLGRTHFPRIPLDRRWGLFETLELPIRVKKLATQCGALSWVVYFRQLLLKELDPALHSGPLFHARPTSFAGILVTGPVSGLATGHG